MKSVLLHIHDDAGQESRLNAALDLVRAFGGHLTCLQVLPYVTYLPPDPMIGGAVTPMFVELIEQGRALLREQRRQIEERLAREGVAHDWIEEDADIASAIVARARLADIVVLSQAIQERAAKEPLPIVGDVALRTRAAVLAVPVQQPGFKADGVALVAWNGSNEAANALRASLPLLARAARVDIVCVEEPNADFPPTEACLHLSRHGIRAEMHQRPPAHQEVGRVLIDTARELDADYIVMGAYGRPRALEYLIGGTTRQMLAESPVPLLLGH